MTTPTLDQPFTSSNLLSAPRLSVLSGPEDTPSSVLSPQSSVLSPQSSSSPHRAVFLDRDGTINVEINYLHRAEDVVLIAGVGAAIARLNAADWQVVVVTNQAGIARGMYDAAAVSAVHAHIAALLAADGAHVDAFLFCPHHPEFGGGCACRKPAPGMLQTAAHDLGLDLGRSWMIGDTLTDVGAGHAAGCRSILVRTGHGADLASTVEQLARHDQPSAIVADLAAAVEWVLHDSASPVGSDALPRTEG